MSMQGSSGTFAHTYGIVVDGLARPQLVREIDARGFIDDPD